MSSPETTTFETILVERRGRVGIITLNRPKALNALNSQLMREVVSVVDDFDRDEGIGAILVTGSEKAFAAGADIKEMQPKSYMDVYLDDFFTAWDRLSAARTPLVAAVSGYALGGGCELAMLCDTPRSATVRARSALTALRLNRDVFVELARQDPYFSFDRPWLIKRSTSRCRRVRTLKRGSSSESAAAPAPSRAVFAAPGAGIWLRIAIGR